MLVGKIVAFELREFGESHGKSETTSKASTFVSGKKKYDPNECRISIVERERREIEEQERELDDLEALIAQRLPKGASKYDGKLPLKCFTCNKIGHFASRCLERMAKYDLHDKFDKYDMNDRYEKHEKYDKPISLTGSLGTKRTVIMLQMKNQKEMKLCLLPLRKMVLCLLIPLAVLLKKKPLLSKVEENSVWVIDNGCYII